MAARDLVGVFQGFPESGSSWKKAAWAPLASNAIGDNLDPSRPRHNEHMLGARGSDALLQLHQLVVGDGNGGTSFFGPLPDGHSVAQARLEARHQGQVN